MNADRIPSMIKLTISEFVADLRESVFSLPEEQCDMVIIEKFFEYLPEDAIAAYTVKHILPFADQIKVRDDNFFITNTHIFAGLPSQRIAHYSTAWKDQRISTENKAVVWQYFDTLVQLCAAYKKRS